MLRSFNANHTGRRWYVKGRTMIHIIWKVCGISKMQSDSSTSCLRHLN